MNRKEIVFNQYRDCGISDETLDLVIDFCILNSPMKTTKYLHWMLRMFVFESHEIGDIVDCVNLFHVYQNLITEKDVLEFKNTIDSDDSDGLMAFEKVVKNPKDLTHYSFELLIFVVNAVRNKRREKEKNKLKSSEYDVIVDDDNYFVVVPLTYKASVILGYGAKWCTASKSCDAHYYEYTKKGILYYVSDKIRKDTENPLYKIGYFREFFSCVGQSYNAKDDSLVDISKLLPKSIVKAIDDYHSKFVNLECVIKDLLLDLKNTITRNNTYFSKINGNKYVVDVVNFDDRQAQISLKFLDNFVDWNVKINLFQDLNSLIFRITMTHDKRQITTVICPETDIRQSEILKLIYSHKRNKNFSAASILDVLKQFLHDKEKDIVSIVINEEINTAIRSLKLTGWTINYNKSDFIIRPKNKKTLGCTVKFYCQIFLGNFTDVESLSLDLISNSQHTKEYVWEANEIKETFIFNDESVKNCITKLLKLATKHFKKPKKNTQIMHETINHLLGFTGYNDYGVYHEESFVNTLNWHMGRYLNESW